MGVYSSTRRVFVPCVQAKAKAKAKAKARAKIKGQGKGQDEGNCKGQGKGEGQCKGNVKGDGDGDGDGGQGRSGAESRQHAMYQTCTNTRMYVATSKRRRGGRFGFGSITSTARAPVLAAVLSAGPVLYCAGTAL